MTYNGVPVVTYFFSTSGGRTEDVENTPLGNEPRPWLKSVDDPYDDASPRHRWGPIRMTLKQAGRKLGGLVKGKFRGIEVVQRGALAADRRGRRVGIARPHARRPAGSCGRASGCSTRGRSSPRSRTGEAPPPGRAGARPPTGGTEPFGSAAWLRARPVGALAGRRAAGAQGRERASCSGARAARG